MADILKTKGQQTGQQYLQKNQAAGKKQKDLYYDEAAEIQHTSETDLKNYYGRGYRIPRSDMSDFVPIIVVLVVFLILISIFFGLRAAKNNRNSIVASTTDAESVKADVVKVTTEENASETDTTTETTTEAPKNPRLLWNMDKETLAKKHDVNIATDFYNEITKACDLDKRLYEFIMDDVYILNDMKETEASETDSELADKSDSTDTDADKYIPTYHKLCNIAAKYSWDIEYKANGAKYYLIYGGEDGEIHVGIASDYTVYEIAPNISKEYDVE